MFTYTHTIRVRYAETDQMRYVHHANYPVYFEEARTEMLRRAGVIYKDMEAQGILLPVVNLTVEYKNPAFYDEELHIITTILEVPSVTLKISYEVINQQRTLICKGATTLVFVDAQTRKPRRIPEIFLEKMTAYYNT